MMMVSCALYGSRNVKEWAVCGGRGMMMVSSQ